MCYDMIQGNFIILNKIMAVMLHTFLRSFLQWWMILLFSRWRTSRACTKSAFPNFAPAFITEISSRWLCCRPVALGFYRCYLWLYPRACFQKRGTSVNVHGKRPSEGVFAPSRLHVGICEHTLTMPPRFQHCQQLQQCEGQSHLYTWPWRPSPH